jgi:nucleoside 2-deoxyribosyltransferase
LPDQPIYCSGPMFDPGDLYDMLQVADTLEAAGYTTYLPQRDGLEIGKAMDLLKNPLVEATFFTRAVTAIMQAGFCMDMYQVVKNCRAVVFNMNGRVPDEGSVVEVATAFTVDKPIVI